MSKIMSKKMSHVSSGTTIMLMINNVVYLILGGLIIYSSYFAFNAINNYKTTTIIGGSFRSTIITELAIVVVSTITIVVLAFLSCFLVSTGSRWVIITYGTLLAFCAVTTIVAALKMLIK